MAVTHFIPTIWSKNILDSLEPKTLLVNNCHKAYEGECKRAGTVKILGVGDVTVVDYVKKNGIDPADMNDTSQDLPINQAKAFAFLVDDIDKAQSVDGLPEEYQRKCSHALAVARDRYVAGLIKAAKNATVAANLTKEAIKAAIDTGIVALRERDFDEEGVIELAPAVFHLFKNELITLSTDNPDYIKRGIVGMYDGFEVVMSNCLAKDSTYHYCDVRGKKAIAFAGQLDEVESLRHPTKFGDIVRGLDVYGAKIIDEARIQCIKVPVTAAAAAE